MIPTVDSVMGAADPRMDEATAEQIVSLFADALHQIQDLGAADPKQDPEILDSVASIAFEVEDLLPEDEHQPDDPDRHGALQAPTKQVGST